VGKATGSRECAPDDKLRVPTIQQPTLHRGGHGARAPLPTLRISEMPASIAGIFASVGHDLQLPACCKLIVKI
jgi:hypothetical protein